MEPDFLVELDIPFSNSIKVFEQFLAMTHTASIDVRSFWCQSGQPVMLRSLKVPYSCDLSSRNVVYVYHI